MLFDIGIAGPIAGFVVAVPALFIGLGDVHTSVRLPADFVGVLSSASRCSSSWRRWLIWGTHAGRLFAEPAPDGVRGLVRPARHGAEPVSDRPARRRPHLLRGARAGGRRTSPWRRSAAPSCLTFFSSSWLVWTVLMVAMLFVFGPRHPRVFDEDVPLDRTRLLLAAVRRRDVRPLLHAGADSIRRAAAPLTPARVRTALSTRLQHRADRRRRSSAGARSGRAGERRSSASRILFRFVALHEELRAVLAAQLAERRRRRPEHPEVAARRRRRSRSHDVRGVVHRRRERARADDGVDERDVGG